MKEPKWYVVSQKNIDEFLERIENESGAMVFTMSVPDYELMHTISKRSNVMSRKQKKL